MIMKNKTKCYKFNGSEQRDQLVAKYGANYFAYVPTEYRGGGYMFDMNSGSTGWTTELGERAYNGNNIIITFEEAMGNPTMQSQIELAKSCLGKTVLYENSVKFKVETIEVVFNTTERTLSGDEQEVLKKQGFVVSLLGQTRAVSVTSVTLEPDCYELKLNEEYTAKVYKDKVVVGCQTFSRKLVQELCGLFDKF